MLKPKNLVIVVLDNGSYQITGSQPTATAYGADLVDDRARRGHRAERLGGGRGDVRAR